VLIQPNSDPWLGGIPAVRKDLDTLIRLTDRALAEHDGVELVVWPETAFVPCIAMHYQRRNDRERYALVEKLLTYIDGARADFVLGNDHAEQGWTREGRLDMLDYNSALLFSPKKNTLPPEPAVYKKTRLVPFTEYFPFEKRFPALYEKLLNGDTHMWEPGKEAVVFEGAGLRFGTPICFEDTFGYIARRFVQNGAQAIVNLSNDAWSKSVSCQYQHLSMAVFRSVENRVPSARSTASGQTAVIDPNGKITAMAEPFVETYIVAAIPKRENARRTLYTALGDWFGAAQVFAALAAGAAGIILRCGSVIKKKPT
jgi:apolipoprotein N-acyltransferase